MKKVKLYKNVNKIRRDCVFIPYGCPHMIKGTCFCGSWCPAFGLTTRYGLTEGDSDKKIITLSCFPQKIYFEVEGDLEVE